MKHGTHAAGGLRSSKHIHSTIWRHLEVPVTSGASCSKAVTFIEARCPSYSHWSWFQTEISTTSLPAATVWATWKAQQAEPGNHRTTKRPYWGCDTLVWEIRCSGTAWGIRSLWWALLICSRGKVSLTKSLCQETSNSKEWGYPQYPTIPTQADVWTRKWWNMMKHRKRAGSWGLDWVRVPLQSYTWLSLGIKLHMIQRYQKLPDYQVQQWNTLAIHDVTDLGQLHLDWRVRCAYNAYTCIYIYDIYIYNI